MEYLEKDKLFILRCKTKSGERLSEEDQKFCELMFKKFPEEYRAMNKEIFEATKPSL